MNPEKTRVEDRANAEFNPAIALLRKTLSSGKDAEDGFREWRRHPYTRAFVNALAELADTPPHVLRGEGGDVNHVLVQYGMTAGLAMAYKLFTQPNRLFPEVFRGDAGITAPDIDDAYVDTQDEVIDQM